MLHEYIQDGQNLSYHIDDKVIVLLKHIKKQINKKDKDYVMLLDGYEGSGKTTFGLQMGKYVDPSLNLDRVCMTAEAFRNAINNAGKGKCVIYDEAITGLGSGDAIARVGKLLKSLMMQMRQKNLFVIVIIPYIFELNKYAVLSRTRFYFHIYERGERQGYFAGFNKKDTRETYIKGKKTHSYPVRTPFIGRFYGKFALGGELEKEYRKKKEQALKEGELGQLEEGTVLKVALDREAWLLRELNKTNTYKNIIAKAKEDRISFSLGDISRKMTRIRRKLE